MIRRAVCILLFLLTGAGWAYWLLAWGATRRLLGQPRKNRDSSFHPPVSILKPIKGVDAEAYENFASFCVQDYPNYEILFAIPSATDPAARVVRRLERDFPRVSIRLIVSEKLGANPKCASLHCLAREARGEALVISDGDIRVGRDYLARVVAPLEDPGVGLVTCPYRGVAPRGLPARLEALHMETVFLPSVALAHRLGECVGMGATMALRRQDLLRAGGFAAIADHLMDDYELARLIVAATERAGARLRTVLSDEVVGSVLGRVKFGQQWSREVRWARGIRVTCGRKYLGLLATYPTPMALGVALVAGWAPWANATLALTLLLRWIIAWDIEGLMGGDRKNLPLLPLRDLLSIGVWSAGAVGSRIDWRGQRFALRRDGRLEPAPAPAVWPGLFGRAVRRLDRFLRKKQGIFDYSKNPLGILRISFGVCQEAVELPDGVRLEIGDRVCDLHLHNEHIPPIGADGAGIAWAAETQRRVRNSLAELAEYLASDDRFANVKALRGQTRFALSRGVRQLEGMAHRLHFEVIDPVEKDSLRRRLHDAGENLLLWAMLRTFNPGGASNAKFVRERHQFLMSRKTLISCYRAESNAAVLENA